MVVIKGHRGRDADVSDGGLRVYAADQRLFERGHVVGQVHHLHVELEVRKSRALGAAELGQEAGRWPDKAAQGTRPERRLAGWRVVIKMGRRCDNTPVTR